MILVPLKMDVITFASTAKICNERFLIGHNYAYLDRSISSTHSNWGWEKNNPSFHTSQEYIEPL